MNCHKLNTIVIRKRYILPFIDVILNRFRIARIIINIDIKNFYYCFHTPKNDQTKIAFLIRYKLFKYLDSPYIDDYLVFLRYFFQHENTFSYITFLDIIPMKRECIWTISKWLESETVRRIQSFFGFINFYQKFVKRFLSITHPLTDITKKIMQ